MKRIMSSHSTD